MSSDMLNLVTLVGSLRKGSYNAALARNLPALAPEGMNFAALGSVGGLPHYDADVQALGFPAAATAMGAAIKAADGVVIVTPEYNYSIPGVLKNALDWLSRLPDKPFAGKPVLIQSAAMGALGGGRAQYHLRQILVFLDAQVFNIPEVMVAQVQNRIDAEGTLTDQPTRDVIANQLRGFQSFVRRAKAGAAITA